MSMYAKPDPAKLAAKVGVARGIIKNLKACLKMNPEDVQVRVETMLKQYAGFKRNFPKQFQDLYFIKNTFRSIGEADEETQKEYAEQIEKSREEASQRIVHLIKNLKEFVAKQNEALKANAVNQNSDNRVDDEVIPEEIPMDNFTKYSSMGDIKKAFQQMEAEEAKKKSKPRKQKPTKEEPVSISVVDKLEQYSRFKEKLPDGKKKYGYFTAPVMVMGDFNKANLSSLSVRTVNIGGGFYVIEGCWILYFHKSMILDEEKIKKYARKVSKTVGINLVFPDIDKTFRDRAAAGYIFALAIRNSDFKHLMPFNSISQYAFPWNS